MEVYTQYQSLPCYIIITDLFMHAINLCSQITITGSLQGVYPSCTGLFIIRTQIVSPGPLTLEGNGKSCVVSGA